MGEEFTEHRANRNRVVPFNLRGEKFFWTDWDDPTKNRHEDGKRISRLEVELGYWRKHPNLHGYIVETFAKGVDECQQIDLNEADLKKIIEAITSESLPHTEGFFFGASDGSEKNDDVLTLQKALVWLAAEEKGVTRSVFYRASW